VGCERALGPAVAGGGRRAHGCGGRGGLQPTGFRLRSPPWRRSVAEGRRGAGTTARGKGVGRARRRQVLGTGLGGNAQRARRPDGPTWARSTSSEGPVRRWPPPTWELWPGPALHLGRWATTTGGRSPPPGKTWPVWSYEEAGNGLDDEGGLSPLLDETPWASTGGAWGPGTTPTWCGRTTATGQRADPPATTSAPAQTKKHRTKSIPPHRGGKKHTSNSGRRLGRRPVANGLLIKATILPGGAPGYQRERKGAGRCQTSLSTGGGAAKVRPFKNHCGGGRPG